jgi:hypothetical protein
MGNRKIDIRQILPGTQLMAALWALMVNSPDSFAGADCKACPSLRGSLQGYSGQLKKYQDLLARNRQYLETQIGKEDTSKKVKVSSNIFVIQVRIETLTNAIAAVDQKLRESGCEQCR